MAECDTVTEVRNPYQFRLTLLSPRGKKRALERILSSLTEWVDPSFQIINVEESADHWKSKHSKGSTKHSGKLVSPALSVMLFMKETGSMCVKHVERVLKKPPWTFHHKVELQNKHSPNFSLGKQEFYSLAKDLPLWAACPVASTDEHLRINLYVHNFKAMVEFYRAVTEVEIETEKPEFCIFQLYQQPGLDIQLSLKYSQYIHPVPLDSAYISLNVKSVDTLKIGTRCDIVHISRNMYKTRDPDGNIVVLYEQAPSRFTAIPSNSSLASTCSDRYTCNQLITSISNIEILDDAKSMKSSSDSQDSGRCSDMDGPLVDNVFSNDIDSQLSYYMKQGHTKSVDYTNPVGNLQDTRRSHSESGEKDIVKVTEHSKGKSTKGIFSIFGRGKSTNKGRSDSTDETKGSPSEKGNIVPVYI